MDIELILVPYDSARRGERMGAGPEALVESGLQQLLEDNGHGVRRTVIEASADTWQAEIHTAFELAGLVSIAVRGALEAGQFPLVLAGNCSAALGVTAGLGSGARVLWADAHADFNTPETTIGGFLDGMALATLTGRCWTGMTRHIPGFSAIPEDRVWLLGARDFDPEETDALEHSRIRQIPASAIGSAVESLVDELDGKPFYFHLDLDVLDAADGTVNSYASPDGVSADNLTAFCDALRRQSPPSAVTLSAYDPLADVDGRARDAAFRAVSALFGTAS